MDNALEQIRLMSTICDLHVLIELSPDSLMSTVVDFTNITTTSYFDPIKNIISEEDLKRLQPYIENVSSFSYAYYPSQKIIGIDNIKTIKKILKYLSAHDFNVLHFDTVSARFLPIIPFISNKKIIATIHDPIPHKGEQSFKRDIIHWIYANIIDEYLFYSIYALNQFLVFRPSLHRKTAILKLLPYTYIQNFKQPASSHEKYILFFGRISAYKGVELLVNAADCISQHYPSLKIYIAGKPHGDYKLDVTNKRNVQYINTYLSISELASLIQHSLFVVCPYKEATQSGVLMTALAMGKPVLATSVGAFTEYVKPGINGLLVEPSINGIQRGIMTMLKDDHYLALSQHIKHQSFQIEREHNCTIYKQLYSN
ncbi:MAG: hypothetical protein RL621_872 [Bacteroidota bacterium]|jgi:glycosyltransferase involved in cell wall biosynthesis